MDKGLDFVDNDNVGKWVTIIYSTLMGLIVLGTSVNLSCVMESMSFAAHLLGKGLLYIFIGTYYLNVTEICEEEEGFSRCSRQTTCVT